MNTGTQYSLCRCNLITESGLDILNVRAADLPVMTFGLWSGVGVSCARPLCPAKYGVLQSKKQWATLTFGLVV